jgi:hypothetical protein
MSGDETYRALPIEIFSFGSDSHAACAGLNGAVFPVSREDARMLAACTAFRTFEEHSSISLSRVHPVFNGDIDAVRSSLERLRHGGAFVSRKEVVDRCRDFAQGSEEIESIVTLAIPTCGNVDQVTRALRSHLDNIGYFGRDAAFLVADDSPDTGSRDSMLSALRKVAHDTGARIEYVGRDAKEAFSTRLIGRGIPADVIGTALFGFGDGSITTGANRNAILLATVGELVLTVDDDMIGCTGKATASLPGNDMLIQGEGDLQDFWYFADRQSALDFVEFSPIDILSAHSALLGKSLPSIVASQAGEGALDIDGLCRHMLAWLLQGAGRVLVTSGGAVGDSGAHSSIPHLTNRSANSRMYTGNAPDDYARLARTREIVRQSRARTVGHNLSFQAMMAGLDNRSLLPPFFPGYRNQDGVFGRILALCIEGACIGHIPMVTEHAPEGIRSYSDNEFSHRRVCNFVMACASLWKPQPAATEPEERMRALGKYFEFLGRVPLADFRDAVRAPLLAELSAFAKKAHTMMAAANFSPDLWARDLNMQLNRIWNRLFDSAFLEPADLPRSSPAADGLEHMQRLIRDYGRLLQWWPEIYRESRELRLSGTRLGSELT